MMKRYMNQCASDFILSDDGEWVKYKEIAVMQAEIDDARDMERGYKERHGLMQAEINTKIENWEQAEKDLLGCREKVEKQQAEIDALKLRIDTEYIKNDVCDALVVATKVPMQAEIDAYRKELTSLLDKVDGKFYRETDSLGDGIAIVLNKYKQEKE